MIAKPLAAAVGLAAALAASTAFAWPTVCGRQGEELQFSARFSAAWENSITLQNTRTGRMEHSFNNYYRRGAGGEWRQGSGNWRTGVLNSRVCYRIVGRHKQSGPNARYRWRDSRYRISGGRVGFEDAGDNDYNDATIGVSYLRAVPRIREER